MSDAIMRTSKDIESKYDIFGKPKIYVTFAVFSR